MEPQYCLSFSTNISQTANILQTIKETARNEAIERLYPVVREV
jgi:hypothetical protein